MGNVAGVFIPAFEHDLRAQELLKVGFAWTADVGGHLPES